ncbi:MAG: signal peptidase I [Candidatus Hydrogenedentota bacterium]|nr:MAG: signal peptidase I [Candidatus Hydrogenedentota bacterium]
MAYSIYSKMNSFSSKKSSGKGKKLFLRTLLILFLLFVTQIVIRKIWLFPIRIPDARMEPSLTKGEIYFFFYGQDVKRGDVVLVKAQNPRPDLLCQVIATEGQTVIQENNALSVMENQRKLAGYKIKFSSFQETIKNQSIKKEIEIRPNYFYCLHQNTSYIGDSRTWGPLPVYSIIAVHSTDP